VSDLLTALPAFDISALEHGMQRFLDQLDGIGQPLGDSSGLGWYPWLAAIAAAAIACEIGRRHLRPPTVLSVRIGNSLAGAPPEEPFTE
jgi:hypothetical protein